MQSFKKTRIIIIANAKLFRKEKNHSQEQAQGECGLNFSRMESIEHDPRLTSLVTLANYGSRTVEDVVKEKEKK